MDYQNSEKILKNYPIMPIYIEFRTSLEHLGEIGDYILTCSVLKESEIPDKNIYLGKIELSRNKVEELKVKLSQLEGKLKVKEKANSKGVYIRAKIEPEIKTLKQNLKNINNYFSEYIFETLEKYGLSYDGSEDDNGQEDDSNHEDYDDYFGYEGLEDYDYYEYGNNNKYFKFRW